MPVIPPQLHCPVASSLQLYLHGEFCDHSMRKRRLGPGFQVVRCYIHTPPGSRQLQHSSYFRETSLKNSSEGKYSQSQKFEQYDSVCVPLGKSQDYINASYTRIVNHGEEYFYIATQGPLPGTTDVFWQMVENNSNVTAVVTRDREDGIIKCHSYWLSPKEPLELRQFRICPENYQVPYFFVIQMFQVVKKSIRTSHRKRLQFTKWADHGTPASTDCFIKYVWYVRKGLLTGPMVVHCSTGVGRTGVFICMDVVFCAIKKNYLPVSLGRKLQPSDPSCGAWRSLSDPIPEVAVGKPTLRAALFLKD
ncbi:LOW QUALITY PROTEIN: tyrosine-protein phosphatase non-receptor type 20 [Erethizon dorsatum]